MKKSLEYPSTEVIETDAMFTAKIWLPHVDQDDITLQLVDGQLIVGVQHENQVERDDEQGHHVMSTTTGFYRQVVLPESADVKQLRALYEHDILTISIPKA